MLEILGGILSGFVFVVLFLATTNVLFRFLRFFRH